MINDNNNNNKLAYAGQMNWFTHLRALLVLHDHGFCCMLLYVFVGVTVNLHSWMRWELFFSHVESLGFARKVSGWVSISNYVFNIGINVDFSTAS
jgi:hypothetical protein